MIPFTHCGWRQWPALLALFILAIGLNSLSAQTLARLDFEAFDGQLTTSPELDALGISFGTPSITLSQNQFNATISPVNAQRRPDDAFSGVRLAANCTSGIDCEFPDGVVLMEFTNTASDISFRIRGFDQGRFFVVYTYDDNGNVELFSRERQTLQWQTVRVPEARGIIIDTDIPPGGGGFRTYYLDDVDWTPGAAASVFGCSTAENYNLRLVTDPVFRQNVEILEQFTVEYLQNIAEEDIYGFGSEVITIPVVVHVVYKNATENISEAQINSQIDALNELFRATNAGANTVVPAFAPLVADLRLQFALARRDPNCEPTNGITRTATTVPNFDGDQTLSTPTARNPIKFNSSGGRNGWPSDKYLNLWVCDLAGSLLGYASFPSELSTRPTEDGVVMDHTAFGTTGTASSGSFNLGRVTAHEIGHWLNLRHIWGDDNAAADQCSGSDFVDDTPNQSTNNSGCPAFPDVSCSNSPNGDMFMNHMDYTSDACRTMFSLGQHVRAAATLFGVRATLIGSDGLNPPPAEPAAPDLWSSDSYDDVGDEPNASTEAMYHSADIWVRNNNDGFVNQEHQNPLYRDGDATNYVYVRVRNRGCSGSQSGTTRLYWAKAGSGLSWPSPWDGSIAAPALMGSPLGSQPVTVAGGEFEILEFAWVVPNPDDYAVIPGDKAHFCLLARTETAGGMTFPETSNLYANVQNNNNIVWKNVSVGSEDEGGGFLAQVIVGNFGEETQFAGLRFNLPAQEIRSLFEYGRVTLELGDLYDRWQQNNQQGQAIEPLGGDVLQLLEPGAFIEGIALEPGEFFGVQVRFEPFQNPGINNVFKLNMTQYDQRREAIIGGNQFRFKTLADGIIRPGGGPTGPNNLPPVFVDCQDDVPQGCTFPVTVRVDMANVARPNNFLGNFTAVLSWDPTLMELVDSVQVLSGYTGFTNIDRAAGTVIFNGASVEGRQGDVPVLTGLFRAIGPVGATVSTQVSLRTLVSARTFYDLTEDAGVFPCEFQIVPQLLLGDVNGDGLINSTDAALILAFSVGNPIPAIALDRINAGVGNVDGNNRTNARDALIILTYDVGLPVDFPLGEATICPNEPRDTPGNGRSALEASVLVGLETTGGLLDIPISVDMSNLSERLGSYDMDLSWDPAKYQFAGIRYGSSPGFDQPAVNESEAEQGHLRLAQAHPGGAAGLVQLATLQLIPLAGEIMVSSEEVTVRLSGMAAAGSFTVINPVISHAGVTSVAETTDAVALSVFPNPFSGVAYLDFEVPGNERVTLEVFNLSGQLVHTLLDGQPGAGRHRLSWDARNAAGKTVPNGVYLLRGSIGTQTVSRRLVLMR